MSSLQTQELTAWCFLQKGSHSKPLNYCIQKQWWRVLTISSTTRKGTVTVPHGVPLQDKPGCRYLSPMIWLSLQMPTLGLQITSLWVRKSPSTNSYGSVEMKNPTPSFCPSTGFVMTTTLLAEPISNNTLGGKSIAPSSLEMAPVPQTVVGNAILCWAVMMPASDTTELCYRHKGSQRAAV